MRKLLLVFIVGLFLLSFTSAITWDNIAYYKLDEVSGTVIDATVNGNNGTTNVTQNVAGKINTAYNHSQNRYTTLTSINASNISISAWVKPNNLSGEYSIVSKWGSGTDYAYSLIILSTNKTMIRIKNSTGTDFSCTGTSNIPIEQWSFITGTYNGTHLQIYVNSTLENSCLASGNIASIGIRTKIGHIERDNLFFGGLIDEVGIWNRSLNSTEVTQLYNFGSGLAYGSTGLAQAVTLISPANGTTLSTIGTNFTVNFNITGANTYNYTWENATYYIWFSNGTLINSTTVILSGNNTIYTQFIDDFIIGDYVWNVRANYGNSTFNNFTWADNNYTFRVGITFNSVTYNTTTYETSNETFTVNFNFNSLLSATSTLVYDGVSYETTQTTCSSNICNTSISLNIPTVSVATNKTFYWNITAYTATTQTVAVSDTYTQTINPLNLSYCQGTNVSVNFTAYDEQTKSRLSPFDFQGNFRYYLGSGNVYKTLVISNTSATQINLCLNVNTSYHLDGTISYSAPAYTTTGSSSTVGNATQSTTTTNASFNYPTRTYYYQNKIFSQTTQNVSLMLLGSTWSSNFLLNVLDSALRPVNGVLIEAQRCYPGFNITGFNNITSFISKTDISGYTSGNLEIYTAPYQFFITNQSDVLLAVTPCAVVSPQSTPYLLTFKLGQAYGSPFDNLENLTDINGSLYYNYTSHQVILTYIDTSGDFVNAQLIVKRMNASGSYQTETCNTNNSLSSGIITCNISTQGSYSATAYIYRTDRILVDQITFDYETNSTTLGYYGVFLGMILLIIGAFAFKFNELAGIWLEFVIIIFCNTLGLIAFGKVFITAYFCIALLISGILER